MTQEINPSPFGEGFDLQAMMEQAQAMQSQLLAAQEKLADTTVEGSSGAVTATLTGTGELTAVTITPGGVAADDPDALADLGDLIVAAYRDAKAKADALASSALGPLAGGVEGLDLEGSGGPGV